MHVRGVSGKAETGERVAMAWRFPAAVMAVLAASVLLLHPWAWGSRDETLLVLAVVAIANGIGTAVGAGIHSLWRGRGAVSIPARLVLGAMSAVLAMLVSPCACLPLADLAIKAGRGSDMDTGFAMLFIAAVLAGPTGFLFGAGLGRPWRATATTADS